MGFGSIEMKVDGSPVSIDFGEEMEVGDITEDMIKVPAQLAYWGAVWAAAESEQMRADAAYRQWRADQGQMLLEADSKMAEWKVKQAVEQMDMFTKLKGALAAAKHNSIAAKGICEAFKVKAHILQSKGAMARAELDSNVSTPKASGETRGGSEGVRSGRESAMRDINKKKAKKPKTKARAE